MTAIRKHARDFGAVIGLAIIALGVGGYILANQRFRFPVFEDKTFPAVGNVYEEATKPLVGLAGESRAGDANGQWFRVLVGGGNFAYPLQQDKVFLTSAPLIGTNPPKPPKRTPLRNDVPCETQERPDLRTVPSDVPQPVKAQIPASRLDDYNKMVDAAVKDLKHSIDNEGLKGKLSVTDKPVTEAALGALKGGK